RKFLVLDWHEPSQPHTHAIMSRKIKIGASLSYGLRCLRTGRQGGKIEYRADLYKAPQVSRLWGLASHQFAPRKGSKAAGQHLVDRGSSHSQRMYEVVEAN